VDEKKFRTFMDLDVWKAARELRKKFYEIARRLPAEEKFGLVSQMRRAAVSVTNNIAEGHGRYHYQENIQFLRHSRGSLEELLDDLTVCSDEQYLEITDIRCRNGNRAGAGVVECIHSLPEGAQRVRSRYGAGNTRRIHH
jgi:four helix bundle protein